MSKIFNTGFTKEFLDDVAEQRDQMYICISEANRADEFSTFNDIEIARAQLHEAKGMYAVLSGLGFLSDIDKETISKELERLTEKLIYIRREKHRMNGILMRTR
ncbi:hypothetical protein I5677_12305 [Mobilitalea sibirica]|uniref:Uncharacterized protein n=1 Tax=Mobilitalea sibirica TaxID=1462919 RepID=A0A8J7KTR7_9FIRM|nr:hypothetical protein [Mobilitalea sibirica]MBH1941676.1 hypothetical protein [Mobilitalea sibirica]